MESKKITAKKHSNQILAKTHLKGVSATLLSPLSYRAAIAKQKNTFFHDDGAVKLARSLNLNTKNLDLHAWHFAIPRCVGRANLFDKAIKRFLGKSPYGTVINLGAGLDTAFSRVDNGKLQWVDLDLPRVISLRKKLLPHNSRVHLLAKSILDLSWIKDIKQLPAPYFFFAGGLFMYITKGQTKSIIKTLAKHFPKSELIFDPCTTLEVMEQRLQMKQHKRFLKEADAAIYKWGLDDPKEFEGWSPKIKVVVSLLCSKGITSKFKYSEWERFFMMTCGPEIAGIIAHLRFLP